MDPQRLLAKLAATALCLSCLAAWTQAFVPPPCDVLPPVHPISGLNCVRNGCPVASTCQVNITVFGPGTDGEYLRAFCECGTQGEAACCHLIAIQPAGGSWTAGVAGQCTPCPLQNTCVLVSGQSSC